MNILIKHLTRSGEQRQIAAPSEGNLVLGRGTNLNPGPGWTDDFLSRQHVRIWCQDGQWLVQRAEPESGKEKAPIFQDAERTKPITEPWPMQPGQWLYVARQGRTAFVLVEKAEDASALQAPAGLQPPKTSSVTPWKQREADDSYDHLELNYPMKQRLKVLQDELPRAIERWMEHSAAVSPDQGAVQPRSDEEVLFDEVSGALRLALGQDGSEGQLSVAFIETDPDKLSATLELPVEALAGLKREERGWRILNAEPSTNASFRPSRRVLHSVLEREPGSVGFWNQHLMADPHASALLSISSSQDWVLAVQLKGSGSAESNRITPLKLKNHRIVLYVGCSGAAGEPPKDALPFLRTVALQVSSLLETREHQRLHMQLGRYFSPRLRHLVSESPEALKPVVYNCTVLFCDRRGSSRSAESAEDRSGLLAKLHENNMILSAVADKIFHNEGAIADFAGDGVLGFWGWPPSDHAGEHAMQAIETARKIAEALKEWIEPNEALSKAMQEIVFDQKGVKQNFDLHFPAFRIGISTGDMAVGNVGLREQMKIGVFGGPVNFGARLEGLGKLFRLPVIVSAETRRAVGDRALMRKLCLVRPAGFEKVYPIYEMVLEREHGGSGATAEQVRRYEEALQNFVERKFGLCIRQLADLVSEGDTGSVWLLETAQDYQINKPAEDWQGQIIATSK